MVADGIGAGVADHGERFVHVTLQLAQIEPAFVVDTAILIADRNDARTAFVHGARRPTAHITKTLDRYGDIFQTTAKALFEQ